MSIDQFSNLSMKSSLSAIQSEGSVNNGEDFELELAPKDDERTNLVLFQFQNFSMQIEEQVVKKLRLHCI